MIVNRKVDCELVPGTDQWGKERRVTACAITGPDPKYKLARDFSLTTVKKGETTSLNTWRYEATIPAGLPAVWEVNDWPGGDRRKRYYVSASGQCEMMNSPSTQEILDAADDPEDWMLRQRPTPSPFAASASAMFVNGDPDLDDGTPVDEAVEARLADAAKQADAQMEALRTIHSEEGQIDLEDALMALDRIKEALGA